MQLKAEPSYHLKYVRQAFIADHASVQSDFPDDLVTTFLALNISTTAVMLNLQVLEDNVDTKRIKQNTHLEFSFIPFISMNRF